ncbi:MAG TPA: o-succinylbenzoate--CoA ligase [Lacisediminihabitans sp.]|uniref:AMP-binding enzyme n=1 Tax=Lacisediminihabitans sp. TaxID=2787631 RepID=UPI002ED88C0B
MLGPGHFDPRDFAAASTLLDAPLRFTSLVPAQLSRLVAAAEQDLDLLDRLRRFDRMLIGGQASSPELIARSLELGLNVTRTYGSSETCGGCVYDGVPIGTAQARIADGQIELAGPMLAEGYLGDPERTVAAFHDADGHRWYRTGDAGVVEDGRLTVTGRLDGILVSGGIKVSLAEVERVAQSVPGLADAVAVRAASRQWGEVPVVFSSGRIGLSSLREAVAATLGRASAPAAFLHLDELPQLSSGKPDRLRLAELAADWEGRPSASQ